MDMKQVIKTIERYNGIAPWDAVDTSTLRKEKTPLYRHGSKQLVNRFFLERITQELKTDDQQHSEGGE
jgi:hypothetical protein